MRFAVQSAKVDSDLRYSQGRDQKFIVQSVLFQSFAYISFPILPFSQLFFPPLEKWPLRSIEAISWQNDISSQLTRSLGSECVNNAFGAEPLPKTHFWSI